MELNNGYLTIEAAKSLDKDDTDKQGPLHPAGSATRVFDEPQLLRRRGPGAEGYPCKVRKTASCSSIPKSAPKQLPKTTAIAIE